jgi:CRISPR-associated protein (TIGR02584 family)
MNILFCVVGSSPQVVTETLYCLASRAEPFIPQKIILLTTSMGKAGIESRLMNGVESPLSQMAIDYGWSWLSTDLLDIREVCDGTGKALSDIRTPEDNTRLADTITSIIAGITADNTTSLHVSLAGGRKSMSFFAGYALTLFGRAQDALSHVLVDEALIGTDFYYPRPGQVVDIQLADIPFVRLSSGMTERLLENRFSFAETIRHIQDNTRAKIHLVLDQRDIRHLAIEVQNNRIPVRPIEMAYLQLLVNRLKNGIRGYHNYEDDEAMGIEIYPLLHAVIEEGFDQRSLDAIEPKPGSKCFDGDYRKRCKNKINALLKKSLGTEMSKPYQVKKVGYIETPHGNLNEYGLNLSPAQITVLG